MIGSDFNYNPPVIHTVCVYWALLLLNFALNNLPSRWLSFFNKVDMVFLSFGTLIIIITLLVMNPDRVRFSLFICYIINTLDGKQNDATCTFFTPL